MPLIIILVGVLLIIIVPLFWATGDYNMLVNLRNHFKNAFAPQHYNDTVMQYNIQREVFPANVIAIMFNFYEAPLFEIADEEDKEVPEVSFG